MSTLTLEDIDSSSDDELLAILSKELQTRIAGPMGSPAFLDEIQKLPMGLRAMAATYALDVSLTLDDLGWHFGNWHSADLAAETIRGLEELGATDLAKIFNDAFKIATRYWGKLGIKNWTEWYHGSPFEKEIEPLDQQARSTLSDKKKGILKYWVDYARRHPERIGVSDT